ncbi:MAG: hypothetical protein J4478_02445 [Candidatus Diapherotrites archaeon]|uniref:Uncharacterized protein n=1 Tax=Candidatus Iainarchaeum sp. TaxID=3101447 RepID=A0A8T4KYH5_9ARCH|nr:MAG: hypothetical protein QT12_C0007G0014 [archaeon GW2011_AR21]MBS3058239.1 hypothetical protein [Candidatus Diapherotrites archaeon]
MRATRPRKTGKQLLKARPPQESLAVANLRISMGFPQRTGAKPRLARGTHWQGTSLELGAAPDGGGPKGKKPLKRLTPGQLARVLREAGITPGGRQLRRRQKR